MNYEKLIEKVLNGKSINARAKELGIPQKTFESYVKAKSFPSCSATKKMAEAAGVDLETAVNAVSEKETEVKPKRAFFQQPAMASVLAAIVIVNLFLTPTPAKAAPVLESSVQELYIM